MKLTACSIGMGAAALTALVLLAAPPVRAQSTFPDVPDDHWAAAAVKRVVEAGIMTGYPQGASSSQKPAAQKKPTKQSYSGNKPVTRYELAVTLYRFVQYLERADRQKGAGRYRTGNVARPASPDRSAKASPPVTSGAEAVKRLIAAGYLPASTPLAKNGGALVTADQLADAMAQVIKRYSERRVPITPESEHAPDPPARPGRGLGT